MLADPTRACPACGKPAESDARYCDDCGAALGMGPRRVVSIGSAPDNDIVLDYSIVSRHHARLLIEGSAILVEDLGSTNGTGLERPDHKISRAPITADSTLFFGSLRVPASRLLAGRLALGVAAHRTLEVADRKVILGRDPEVDLVLDDPSVSWQHACLVQADGRTHIADLGSTNGTFVNGARINGWVRVEAEDIVAVGRTTLRLRADGSLELRDGRGNLTISVRDLAVDVPGQRLVEGVSLTLFPGELVGLMGPSGAGKTTLMLAMNGYLRPRVGCVLYNGQDLYAHYDQFRLYLGYVPQDDIMHGDLTVREALAFSARLRLPSDTRESEIEERIRKVLAELGLAGTENVLIGSSTKKGISGGQRKRVNLAMELLTDPSVLFLDEPTSGLSSEDALMVMTVLRRLANRGKTILLTIHQPSREVFRQMDDVVLLARDAGSRAPGGVAYFGPAYPDSIHFFNPDERSRPDPSPDRLLEGLSRQRAREQIAAYARSGVRKRYVEQRSAAVTASLPTTAPLPPRPASGDFGQWSTLVARGLRIKARDAVNTTILVLQAPVIASLIVLVFGAQVAAEMTPETWHEKSGATATTLFLVAIAALWFGCSNAAREVVAEWAIYHRERMISLSLPAYVASKLALLGAVCVVQCLALVVIVHSGCGLRTPLQPILGVVVLTSLVGMALGLLISARSSSSEVAISLVPLALLPMVILGGILQPPHKMTAAGGALTQLMPSRWAFESLLVMEAGKRPRSTPLPGQPPTPPADVAERYFPEGNKRSARATPIVVLATMAAALTWGIQRVLLSRDVHRRGAR